MIPKSIFLFVNFLIVTSFCAASDSGLMQFWLVPDTEQLIQIPVSKSTEYKIKNYQGCIVKEGKGLDGIITLKLPKGYYFIEFDSSTEIYGVSVVEPFKGKRDPFFCIDSAMSWLEVGKKNKMHRENMVKLLKDFGVSAARERIWWGDINPKPESWNFEGGRRNYDEVRRLLKKYDITCLDLYHDAPRWTGAGKADPYPKNLNAVVDAWNAMSKHWGENWCGWEIWNEPNIGFGKDLPADQYMTLVKASAYAAKQTGWKKALIGGVYSIDYISAFQEQCAENGLLDHVNTVSYHAYNTAMSMENSIADYRKWLKKYGHENMPIWLTENGYSYTTGMTGDNYLKELRSSALNIAMKAVEAKACGVARNFPFVYSAYAEGASSFSLFFKNYSPMPQLNAYFNVIQLLSGKRYIGDFIHQNEKIKKARVFADKSDRVIIVFYTGKIDEEVMLSLPFECSAFDIDGSLLRIKEGQVTFESGMIYIQANRNDLKGLINSKTRAMKLVEALEHESKWSFTGGDGVIISAELDMKKIYKHTADGYYITEKQADKLAVEYSVSNLTGQEKKVILYIDICSPEGAALMKSHKQSIQMPAKSVLNTKTELGMKEFLNKYRSLKVKAYTNSGSTNLCTYILQNPTIAKAVPKGHAAKCYTVADQTNWLTTGQLWYGKKDLAMTFSCSWTPEWLTFVIDIKDNIHHQTYCPEKMWRGDSVQLAVQCLKDNEYPVPKQTTQLCVGIKDKKAAVFADRVLSGQSRKDVMSAVQVSYEQNDGKRYIIKIPAATLGVKQFYGDQVLGYSVLVNDNDGYGRKGALCWGEGIAKYNGNTKTYNRLKLEKKEEVEK